MNKKKHQQPRTASHHQQPPRESRDRSQGGSRPSSVAKDVPSPENSVTSPTEEAFKNKRLVHACTSLIGSKVSIEVSGGAMYEGIFRLFSPQFEIILEVVHLVDPTEPSRIREEKVLQTMVFPFKNIVRCTAIDTDLNYAKEVFLTDSQISSSKNNGDVAMRQLEEWQPDADDNVDYNKMSLGNGHGWAPEDMFAHNASKHGYKTSFSSNLEGYTVQLKVEDSEEYREREAFAAQKAREIEGSDVNRTSVELDDGDEESAFSAVHRPARNEGSEPDSKRYVPPAKRNSSNSHVRDQRGPGPRLQGSSSHYQSPGQTQHGSRDFHQRNKTDKDYQTQSGPQHAPSPHSARDLQTQNQHHRGGRGRSGGGGSQLRRSSAQGREQSRDEHEQQAPRQQGSGRGGHGMQSSRSREQLSDLKEFGNKFQLAPSQSAVSPPELPSPKSLQQSYIPQQPYNSMTSHAQIPPSHGHLDMDNIENRDGGMMQRTEESQQDIHHIHPSEGDQDQTSEHSPSPATPTATAPAIKSTLNPNAKEFTLNPNAGAFVPGAVQAMVAMSPSGTPSMSATPPQRPITPGTPLSYPPTMMPAHQQFIQGAPGHAPIVHYLSSASVFNPQPQIAYGIPQSPSSGQMPQPQGMHPGDMGPPNQMMGPPMHPGANMVGGSPSQVQGYMQPYPPQQQFNPNMAILQANQQNMMMRLPHGGLSPMMLAQSAGGSGVQVAGMVDMSGHQQHPMITWMSQGPMPQLPPPPPGNASHLVQPPPPPTVASQIPNQLPGQQQPSQQVGSNGGGHTPAPSPGPMSMYNPAVPQSMPHQFTGSFSPNVFVVSHGGGHQPPMMPGQGQIPQMHGYAIGQHTHPIPSQQNAPHLMIPQSIQQGPPVPPPLAPQ